VLLSKAVWRESESEVWQCVRDCLLDVADEVCGRTKGQAIHCHTWRWNDELAELIQYIVTPGGGIEDKKQNVFRVARQMVRLNRDVVGSDCVKDVESKVVVEEDQVTKNKYRTHDMLK